MDAHKTHQVGFNLAICKKKECLFLHVIPRSIETGGFWISCALGKDKADIGILRKSAGMPNATLGENVKNLPINKVIFHKYKFIPPEGCDYRLEHLMGFKP